MKTLIVYDSQFGNTQQIAETLASELGNTSEVQLLNVRQEQLTISEEVDLLIVGGPTQMHGVSRPLQEQLDALPPHSLERVPVATFDTKVHGPRLLTGAASGGIGKPLMRRGARLAVKPESFLVASKEGPLAEGELARARTWAQQILSAVRTPVTPGP